MHYNSYGKQLTDDEIKSGEHRRFVGSYWEELGKLQFDYLVKQGLKPHHKLLDLGCGALRGGIHFIRYLEEGHYTGIDANTSLIRAGETELKKVNLDRKSSNFIIDENFEYEKWGGNFDYIISISLFTHLPISKIKRCLDAVSNAISQEGKYFASFFRLECDEFEKKSYHKELGIKTHDDLDPFHQKISVLRKISESMNLEIDYKGSWNHPRGQEIILFKKNQDV
jgi:2-polyprenyl-3-methyl-5-hydroxy-6-metoxy-1,4-benzoquinol methylase